MKIRTIFSAFLLILAGGFSTAVGQSYWDLNGSGTDGSGGPTPSGNWDDVGPSWNFDSTGNAAFGNTHTWNNGDQAIFAAGSDATGTYTVTVGTVGGGAPQVNGIAFEEGAVTIDGLAINLTGATVDVADTLSATISASLSGSAGLTKTSNGALILSGANTFTGTVAINTGTLSVGTGATDVDRNANLGNVANGLQIGNATLDILGTLGGSQAGANTRSIALTGAAKIITEPTSGGAGTATWLNGTISGSGNLTKSGVTTLVLLNRTDATKNTYTGDTTITQGTLVSTGINSLGDNTTNPSQTIHLNGTGATFRMSAAASSNYIETRPLILEAPGGQLDSGNSGLSFTTDATYSGVISGSYELTRVSSGTIKLYGNNTYGGGTILNTGTTAIKQDNNLGAGGTSLTFNSATLRTDAAFDPSGIGAFSRPITMTGAGTIDTNGFDSTFSSVISGNGNLTKTGAGRLTLTGDSPSFGPGGTTAGGQINVSAGTLVVPSNAPANVLGAAGAANNSLGSAPNNTVVSNGATMEITGNYNGRDQIILAGNGVSGGGALRKVGANQTTISGYGITLNGATTGGRITSADAGGTLVLSNSSLQRNNATGPPPLTFDGAGDIVTTGSGNGGNWNFAIGTSRMFKTGIGSLTLGGISSWFGGLTINQGIVNFSTDTTSAGSQQLGQTTNDGLGVTSVYKPAAVIIDGGTLRATNSSTIFTNSNRGMQIGPNGGTVEASNALVLWQSTITKVPGTNTRVTLTKTGTGEFRYNANATNDRTLTDFDQLVVKAGLFRLGSVSGHDTELGFGAVPSTPTSDAIVLDGGQLGNSFTSASLNANRGITLGTGINAVNGLPGGVLTGNFVIPGIISGAGGLLQNGSTSTLTGVNTYQGKTQAFASGTIIIQADSGLGTAPSSPLADSLMLGGATTSGTLQANANLTLDSNRGITIFAGNGTLNAQPSVVAQYGGVITGAGSLTKSGSGTWVLSGVNTYTGATNVSAGTLLVNGSITSAVSVASGATLGGTGGTVAGAVSNSGTIAPGASIGQLNVTGNVTMNDNSILSIELGSGTSSDRLAINGNLNLNSTLGETLALSGSTSGGPWTIATYTGALNGTFETVTGLPSGYQVDYGTTGQIKIDLATASPDYNTDGKVNAADYVTWRKDPTNPVFGGDPAGYANWRQAFAPTTIPGPELGSSFRSPSPVPEPGTLLLTAIGILLAGASRRRRP